MGIFNKLAGMFKLKKEQMTILVVGLNNSGKSTIINHFRTTDERTSITVPTVGFTVEQFQNQGITFKAFDMSGASRYRNLWEYHFKSCQGIVYVIDSSDRMRLVVVKDELELLLQHPDLANRRIPLLFYGNKMDCADALSSVKIAAALGLDAISDKPWHISSSNALTGDGLEEVVVKDELELLLQHPDLANRRIPLLFYGNKMDCADALSSVKIAAALGLDAISDKPWHISSSNALTGDGLEEGVNWLIEQIRMSLSESRDHKKRKMSMIK